MQNENSLKSYLFSSMSSAYSYIEENILTYNSKIQPDNFTDDELKMITASRLICSGISIFACMWILFFYTIMCIKFRCSKRRSSVSFNRQITDSIPDCENLQTSFVSNNNYENLVNKRNKSVFKSNKGLRLSDIGSNKMGIGKDLIFFLILSNLGWSMANFLSLEGFDSGEAKNDPYCISQAFIQNFFDISSLCFTMLISRVTLLGTTKCYADIRKVKYRMTLFMLYSIGCPLILTIGPYLTDSLGCSGAWCWIDIYNTNTLTYLWIVSIYVFDWANILYIIYALVVACQYFEKRKVEINSDQTKSKELRFLTKYVMILKAFPVILMINRMPGLINRLYTLFFHHNSFYLFMIHSIAINLSGFFNSLIYSYFYRRVFKCCRKKTESIDITETEVKIDSSGINSSK